MQETVLQNMILMLQSNMIYFHFCDLNAEADTIIQYTF